MIPPIEDEIYRLISDFFQLIDFEAREGGYFFTFLHMKAPFEEIKESLEKRGYYLFLRKRNGENLGMIVKRKPETPESPLLPLILLILTFFTTTWAGYNYSRGLVEMGYLKNVWIGALSFSLSLLLILGSHEMGHKIASIKSKVISSGPFFIPVPPFILPLGTLGAVIRMKSPLPDKNAAIRLGASGPITGFLVSGIVLYFGIRNSFPVDITAFVDKGPLFFFGEPLLFKILKGTFTHLSPGSNLLLHPLAFSGWVGLFVTALNLIPVGQLDGGHILRALLGPVNFRRASAFIIGFLFIMGIKFWEGWILWAILGIFFSLAGNPGSLNELEEVKGKEKIVAFFTLIIFILSFMPVPIKVVSSLP